MIVVLYRVFGSVGKVLVGISGFNFLFGIIYLKYLMSKAKSNVKAPAPAPAKGGAFDAKRYASSSISEDEVNNIKQAFDLFDTDQGGSIDIKGNTSHMQNSRPP